MSGSEDGYDVANLYKVPSPMISLFNAFASNALSDGETPICTPDPKEHATGVEVSEDASENAGDLPVSDAEEAQFFGNLTLDLEGEIPEPPSGGSGGSTSNEDGSSAASSAAKFPAASAAEGAASSGSCLSSSADEGEGDLDDRRDGVFRSAPNESSDESVESETIVPNGPMLLAKKAGRTDDVVIARFPHPVVEPKQDAEDARDKLQSLIKTSKEIDDKLAGKCQVAQCKSKTRKGRLTCYKHRRSSVKLECPGCTQKSRSPGKWMCGECESGLRWQCCGKQLWVNQRCKDCGIKRMQAKTDKLLARAEEAGNAAARGTMQAVRLTGAQIMAQQVEAEAERAMGEDDARMEQAEHAAEVLRTDAIQTNAVAAITGKMNQTLSVLAEMVNQVAASSSKTRSQIREQSDELDSLTDSLSDCKWDEPVYFSVPQDIVDSVEGGGQLNSTGLFPWLNTLVPMSPVLDGWTFHFRHIIVALMMYLMGHFMGWFMPFWDLVEMFLSHPLKVIMSLFIMWLAMRQMAARRTRLCYAVSWSSLMPSIAATINTVSQEEDDEDERWGEMRAGKHVAKPLPVTGRLNVRLVYAHQGDLRHLLLGMARAMKRLVLGDNPMSGGGDPAPPGFLAQLANIFSANSFQSGNANAFVGLADDATGSNGSVFDWRMATGETFDVHFDLRTTMSAWACIPNVDRASDAWNLASGMHSGFTGVNEGREKHVGRSFHMGGLLAIWMHAKGGAFVGASHMPLE